MVRRGDGVKWQSALEPEGTSHNAKLRSRFHHRRTSTTAFDNWDFSNSNEFNLFPTITTKSELLKTIPLKEV